MSATPKIALIAGATGLVGGYALNALLDAPDVDSVEEGNRVLNVPARMTARVRIPPAQVFEIMKALEAQLTAWERETGR